MKKNRAFTLGLCIAIICVLINMIYAENITASAAVKIAKRFCDASLRGDIRTAANLIDKSSLATHKKLFLEQYEDVEKSGNGNSWLSLFAGGYNISTLREMTPLDFYIHTSETLYKSSKNQPPRDAIYSIDVIRTEQKSDVIAVYLRVSRISSVDSSSPPKDMMFLIGNHDGILGVLLPSL